MTGTSPYAPPGGYFDEAIGAGGELREVGGAGVAALGGMHPGELAAEVQRVLTARGVNFHSAGGTAEFSVDPVPRVFGGEEWDRLEGGLIQRVRALNAFVADVYGARRAVAEGVVPERVIESAESYEERMRGVRQPGDLWIGIAGLDLVRDAHGELLVLEDNVRTPSGFGYAVEARRAVLGHLGEHAERLPRPLDGVVGMLGGTLRSAAPGARDPLIVVLTDGEGNSAAFEHAWAAEQLGVPLVEPHDLRASGDRLLFDGRSVDVIYRRTDADRIDTEVGALLAGPIRAGTVTVLNAFGTGVADDKLAHAYVEDMIRFYLGEEPLLRSVETLDLARPGAVERALDELDTLVVKPRYGSGGHGVVICAHAEKVDLERLREELRGSPELFVAQPLIDISLHPTVIDGELRPRHVDLRPFVFMRASGSAAVMPGGLTRVAFGEGALVVNSTQDGGAKDTWVLP